MIVSAPETNHGNHITVGALQGFAASALSLPTGLVTAAFLTRQLGPHDYGLLTVTASIVVWIEVSISLGFGRAAVKLLAVAEDWQAVATSFLQAQFLVALGAAALLFAVAPSLAMWLNTAELATYLRLFSLDLPLHALYVIHRSVLIGRGQFGRRALLTAAFWLARMVLILMFVGFRPTISAAILAFIGTSMIVLIGARVFIRPAFLKRSPFPFRNLWDYAWPLFFYSTGMHLFSRLDLLFVKALSSLPEAAGFYGAAQNLTIVPALFAGSLTPLLLAKLSQQYEQGEREYACHLIKQSMRAVFCLLPFAGMTAGAASEVAVAIYGLHFPATGPLLAILIFGALGSTMIAVNAAPLIAAGRPKLTFALTVPLVTLALGLHFILVPRLGPIGAAATTTGLAWLGAGASLLAVYRIWGVLLPAATCVRSILVCGLAYLLAALWPAPGLLLVLKLPAISIAIVLLFMVIGEIRAGEIAFARSILRLKSGTIRPLETSEEEQSVKQD